MKKKIYQYRYKTLIFLCLLIVSLSLFLRAITFIRPAQAKNTQHELVIDQSNGNSNAPKEALDVVKSFAEQSLAIIRSTDNAEQKKEKFLSVFTSNVTVDKLAAFCLGQYVRLPTDSEKKIYIDSFLNFVGGVYITRLDPYKNAQLMIMGSQMLKKNQFIVNTSLDIGTNTPVKIDWWVIQDKNGQYKIFDLNVAGVWLAQEQRAVFTSIIQNNGGKFSALLSMLNNNQASNANNG